MVDVSRETCSPYDMVVVGAGHAGCEAALAGARMGLKVALVTVRLDRIAAMSCNPAIGGLGKSHMVREIDALGGQMAVAADMSAIQFRRLNSSKGPAVRARRVQCDMYYYQQLMRRFLLRQEGLELIEGEASEVLTGSEGVRGIALEDGRRLQAKAVVLTTGTFLRGRAHVGLESVECGRLGDPPSKSLSGSLERLGLKLGRMKTGTPPRIAGESINKERCDVQQSDHPWLGFSHETVPRHLPEVVCLVTRTNEKTHEQIRAGLDRSPLFTGVIRGIGPRYCPSIEDKVVRFPDRKSHQVILEPVDVSCTMYYPNGISTSLPRDVQGRFVRSIEGLENAEIISDGYAIEYDFSDPTQLSHTLECRKVPGLFLAGQVNGTSGYEEAAAQGLVAGINAALKIMGKPPLVLGRQEAYTGVMIDDLVTKGVSEPYRMFSSRAEYRLLLREDNAFARLGRHAERLGLLESARIESRKARERTLRDLLETLKNTLGPKDERGRRVTLEVMLRRPGNDARWLAETLQESFPEDILERAEVEVKYSGYIKRQIAEAERLTRLDRVRIPPQLDFARVPGLSAEIVEKLSRSRPSTLSEASRIEGMTPAALSVLAVWVASRFHVKQRGGEGGS